MTSHMAVGGGHMAGSCTRGWRSHLRGGRDGTESGGGGGGGNGREAGGRAEGDKGGVAGRERGIEKEEGEEQQGEEKNKEEEEQQEEEGGLRRRSCSVTFLQLDLPAVGGPQPVLPLLLPGGRVLILGGGPGDDARLLHPELVNLP